MAFLEEVTGSELFFTLDSQSCNNVNNDILPGMDIEVKPSAQPGPGPPLARGLRTADWQGVEETRLQRTVRDLMAKLQQEQLLVYEDMCAGSGAAGLGGGSSRSTALKELCLTLRLQGLDARVLLPFPLGGSGCGRQSTGGGGQCASGAGKRCFFCSRQPYAVVRSPSPSGPDGPRRGQWQEPCQQQQRAGSDLTELTDQSGVEDGLLVVEPCLRELFRVAPLTPEYGAIVEELPQVWVGPRAALLELADRMCDAMAINFRSQGLDVPPWRRRATVLSRWDERNQRELSLQPEPQMGLLAAPDSDGKPAPPEQVRVEQKICFHANSSAAPALAGPAGPGLLPVVRSASASADATDAPSWPQNSAAAAAALTTAVAAEDGHCGAAATRVTGALQALRLGCVCNVWGCCNANREGVTHSTIGQLPAPSVVVYGFNVPGPACAV